MLLGSVVGIGAAKAVLGHFSVMVKDIAQLFVAGPPVVSHAMGYDITKEELGGWHIHCTNGSVHNLAESEDEAMALTRRFLSYLPSSTYEAPPVTDCSDETYSAVDTDLLIEGPFTVDETLRLSERGVVLNLEDPGQLSPGQLPEDAGTLVLELRIRPPSYEGNARWWLERGAPR